MASLAELRSELTFIEKPLLSACDWLHKHPDIYVTQRRALYKYCKEALATGGEVSVIYKRKLFGPDKIPLGRFYADATILSAPYQPVAVKATIFAHTDTDVDAVASHPTVLLGLAKKYLEDAQVASLEHYICKRQEVLDSIEVAPTVCERYNKANNLLGGQSLCIRDIKKLLFNILCYGGGVGTWTSKFDMKPTEYKLPPFVKKFQTELKAIVKELLCCEDLAPIAAIVKKQMLKDNKTAGNLDFKTASILIQTFETELVLIMLDEFRNNDINVSGFIYDGFHISSKDEPLMKRIFENGYKKQIESYGFSMPFTVKGWSEPLLEPTPDTVIDDGLYFDYFDSPVTVTYSNIIIAMIKDKYLFLNKSLYIYAEGVWNPSNMDKLYGYIQEKVWDKIVEKLIIYMSSPADRINRKIIESHTGNHTPFNAALTAAVKRSKEENPLVDWDAQPHLLNFLNGTYNFKTHTFQPHNRDDFMRKQVPCEFDPLQVKAHEPILNIFKDWFEIKGQCEGDEMRDYINFLLYIVAVCLDGSNDYQKALVLYGRLSRNGKSSFTDLMNNTLGNYVGSIPYSHFTSNDQNPNGAKPYLLTLQGLRYAFVNEADNSHHEIKGINNKPFKEITGKDALSARDVYGNRDQIVTFKPQFLVIMPCNDVIKFMKEENATTNRLTVTNFDCYFGNENYTGWDATKPHCKRLDMEYNKKVLQNKLIQQQFVHHLIWLNKEYKDKDSPVSTRQVNDEKYYKGQVDEIKAWCDGNIVEDRTDFDMNTEKDNRVCQQYPKLHGNPRCMTLDHLYYLYKKDVSIPAPQTQFYARICAIFSDLYPKDKLTKLFTKQKRYIRYLRYTAYDGTEDMS